MKDKGEVGSLFFIYSTINMIFSDCESKPRIRKETTLFRNNSRLEPGLCVLNNFKGLTGDGKHVCHLKNMCSIFPRRSFLPEPNAFVPEA